MDILKTALMVTSFILVCICGFGLTVSLCMGFGVIGALLGVLIGIWALLLIANLFRD